MLKAIRNFIVLPLGLALGLLVGCLAEPSKPNIVLFVGDDHSVWDVGCYGNKVIKTPNLDLLASQGMRFDRAFTITAMCAPARSMLYTGLGPVRNGCYMNHGKTHAHIKSLPHYLKPLGYRVVLAGKTHIKPKSVYPFEYVAQREAYGVIQGDEPFCLIVASNEPHTPHTGRDYPLDDMTVPPYLPDLKSAKVGISAYYTDIDKLDREIGGVMAMLKSSGIEKNTLFVYAGDHGYGLMAKWTCYETGLRVPFIVRWPGMVKAGSSTDAMVSFVDVLPTFLEAAGAEPAKDIDGKSFIGVLSGEKKTHRDRIYGLHTNQGIIYGQDYPVRSVRDNRFKYIRNLNPDGRPTNVSTCDSKDQEKTTGLWGEWREAAKTDEKVAKLLKRVMDRPAEELYDLEADPWELNNLAKHPDHAKTKARLRRELDQWMKQQGDQGMASELKVELHKTMR